jgi:hypothetical protein
VPLQKLQDFFAKAARDQRTIYSSSDWLFQQLLYLYSVFKTAF